MPRKHEEPHLRDIKHAAKRKTRKQIERMLIATGHNRHHRRPRKFCGTLKEWNMSWVKIKQHKHWHALFKVGWPPRERIARPINETWLDMKFLMLSIKTRLFFRAVRHVYSSRRRYGDPNQMPREQLLESHRLLTEMLDMRQMTLYEYFIANGVSRHHLLRRAIEEDQQFFGNEFDGHRRRNGNGNGVEHHEHE